MKRFKYSIGAAIFAFIAIAVASFTIPHMAKAVAPGTQGTSYPTGADNGSDIWTSTGPSTYITAPLAGLVANTPVNIIAAVPGKQIVVVAVSMCSSIANSTVQFQDETAVTPVVYSGKYTFPANGFILLPFNKAGYITLPVNTPLDIAIAGSSDVVGGTITYYLK